MRFFRYIYRLVDTCGSCVHWDASLFFQAWRLLQFTDAFPMSITSWLGRASSVTLFIAALTTSIAPDSKGFIQVGFRWRSYGLSNYPSFCLWNLQNGLMSMVNGRSWNPLRQEEFFHLVHVMQYMCPHFCDQGLTSGLSRFRAFINLSE